MWEIIIMHKMKDVEAVFFDLDDTLYDQLTPFKLALEYFEVDLPTLNFEELFKRVRYFSDVFWKVHTKGEMSLERLRVERLKCAFNDFGISLTNKRAEALQERYEFEQQQIQVFPEVRSLIEDLQTSKSVVGILTNGPVKHQMNKIKALQMNQLIQKDSIFISDGIGIAKPDKRVFEFVQNQINIQPEKCCYIGDTWENDIVPPIEAGWKCIWFNHRKREQQSLHAPNKIIFSYKDLSINKCR
jgi:putative hydrolase of the HAD superfamily